MEKDQLLPKEDFFMREKDKQYKLLATFLLFLLLFNFPVLSIFNHAYRVAGIPVLYVYIFLSWIGFVVFTANLLRKAAQRSKTKPYDS